MDKAQKSLKPFICVAKTTFFSSISRRDVCEATVWVNRLLGSNWLLHEREELMFPDSTLFAIMK